MRNKGEKKNQQEEGQPGAMESYNNREDNRKGRVEETGPGKPGGEKNENSNPGLQIGATPKENESDA